MFTVVQDTDPIQSTTWFVLDDHGEERFAHSLLVSAVRFAARLITEEQDHQRRKQDALQAEAHNFVRAAHRRGAAQAYRHCALRLSFLLGGTLPPAGKVEQARLLLASMDEWAIESHQKADEIDAQINAKVAAVV